MMTSSVLGGTPDEIVESSDIKKYLKRCKPSEEKFVGIYQKFHAPETREFHDEEAKDIRKLVGEVTSSGGDGRFKLMYQTNKTLAIREIYFRNNYHASQSLMLIKNFPCPNGNKPHVTLGNVPFENVGNLTGIEKLDLTRDCGTIDYPSSSELRVESGDSSDLLEMIRKVAYQYAENMDDKKREQWQRISGLEEVSDGFSYTKSYGRSSARALSVLGENSPEHDFMETFLAYRFNPRSLATHPERQAFMRDNVFNGFKYGLSNACKGYRELPVQKSSSEVPSDSNQ